MNWMDLMYVMAQEEKVKTECYSYIMREAPSPELQALFQRLRDDEAEHARLLNEAINALAKERAKADLWIAK
jgi:rubrerythrin